MNGDVVGWVLGGMFTLVGAILTTIAARRINHAKAKLDEVSAYSTLVKDLQGEMARMRTENAAMRSEVDSMRTELDRSQSDNAGLRRQLDTLKRALDRQTRQLARMTALLEAHNIPIPQEA